MIDRSRFRDSVKEMLRLAATRLPTDVVEALERAREEEENKFAKYQLDAILENLEIAEDGEIPLCQDTGIPVFFVRLGRETDIGFDVKRCIEEAVKEATGEVPLRSNVVDPFSRDNLGDNTGLGHPLVYFDLVDGGDFVVDLLLKGGGSENWSRLFMMNPNCGVDDIVERVVGVVSEAGGQPCPPTIVGVGVGGTADHANHLAKKALLKPINQKNENDKLAELEEKITKNANSLDIGPMGLGGKTTVLGTKAEKAGCHTASLPVAINLNCWAARRSRARFIDDEIKVEVP